MELCLWLIVVVFLFLFPRQIFLNQSFVSDPLPDTDVTISLPSGLGNYFTPGEGNKTRVQFHFYGSQKLFQVQKPFLVSSPGFIHSYEVGVFLLVPRSKGIESKRAFSILFNIAGVRAIS